MGDVAALERHVLLIRANCCAVVVFGEYCLQVGVRPVSESVHVLRLEAHDHYLV